MLESTIVPAESIAESIVVLRGQKVILDAELARLYGVDTRTLNQAIKRNRNRFPQDFMFRVTKDEKAEVITKCDHLQNLKYSPSLPYAFTEHGAVMAATILNSPRAVEVSVYVVRAFLKLRSIFAAHDELSHRLDELDIRVSSHDDEIALLVDAIRQLALPPEGPDRRIGFHENR